MAARYIQAPIKVYNFMNPYLNEGEDFSRVFNTLSDQDNLK